MNKNRVTIKNRLKILERHATSGVYATITLFSDGSGHYGLGGKIYPFNKMDKDFTVFRQVYWSEESGAFRGTIHNSKYKDLIGELPTGHHYI